MKPWESSGGRRGETRLLQRHLILCEDKKSSADYFRSFKISSRFAEVRVEGGIGNTRTVVEHGLKMREDGIRAKNPWASIWCVFDRDSFPAGRFNAAFQMAEAHQDVHVIWSNEAFEIWYLLHFVYRDTPLGRHDLCKEVAKLAGLAAGYSKADDSLFAKLEPHLEIAIRNAKKLLHYYGEGIRPETANPSTSVHLLVNKLLALRGLE